MRALARVDAFLAGVRDQLTTGQRWTAALVVSLCLTVLLFGLPTAVSVRSVAGRAFAPTRMPIPHGQEIGNTTPAAPVVFRGLAPVSDQVPSTPSPPSTALSAPTVAAPARVPVPRVVALARSGDGAPGRDDAAIAAAYLATAHFPSSLFVLDGADPTLCRRVLAAGTLVLASGDIGTALRSCLVARGATVLAADPEGDLLRRGTTDVLIDLARWPGLAPRVGLVAPTDQRAAVDAALAVLHPAGVAWLDPDPSGVSEIPAAVDALVAKGVTTTVFAVPVAQQQRWLVDAALLDPGMRYVVTDVADGVIDEEYPPTFDGAVAYTSVRTPWYERTHGDTPVQAACKQRWRAAAPPGLITTTELAHAYAWCLAVATTSAGLGALVRSTSFREAVRSVAVPSPLTSDLGPLPGGGFGPTEDAVLAWSARCICWTEDKPFQARR